MQRCSESVINSCVRFFLFVVIAFVEVTFCADLVRKKASNPVENCVGRGVGLNNY